MRRFLLLLVPVLLVALAFAAQRPLRIEGSDTMYLLNLKWAEAYGKANPGRSVAVRGGGTRLGIPSLSSGVADLSASSRRYFVDEISAIRGNGVEAYENPVALDALVVAVPETNATPSLTLADLKKIYLGQAFNWKEFGGPDLPIQAISRDTNSGTHDLFRAQVLQDQEWGPSVRFLGSTALEAKELLSNPGAVAYGGIAYFKGLKGVRLMPIAKNGPAVAPSEETVRDRTYPLWRFLFFYTNGKPRGEVKRFLDFIQSPAGQEATRAAGYFPLKR